jgi:hypothetical protein
MRHYFTRTPCEFSLLFILRQEKTCGSAFGRAEPRTKRVEPVQVRGSEKIALNMNRTLPALLSISGVLLANVFVALPIYLSFF